MTPRTRALLITLAALLLTAFPARASVMGVELFVNGELVGSQTVEARDGVVPIAFNQDGASFQIDGTALIDADPFIIYSFVAANFGDSAQLFTLSFDSPYTGGPFNTLEADFSSTASDLDGNTSVSVVPANASGLMTLPHIDGVDVPGARLGSGCNLTIASGSTDTCDAFGTASAGVSTLADGNFGVTISFLLSGGDSVTGQGRLELKDVTEVPEPVSAVLLGLGLSGIALRRRRAH